MQGRVDTAEVLRLLQALLDAGADRVSLADTVGYADPACRAHAVRRRRCEIAGDRFWCGHFHDTRGLALANVAAALDVGVARFDASLAGIGGCPHAPGASGNVATEDAAFMLASMGMDTGIDLPRLLALRATRGGLARRRDAARHAVARRPADDLRRRETPPRRRDDRMDTANATNGALPLAGVRVIEFTHMVMGPTCGMILADLGAEVIKIEPPGGDKTRNAAGARHRLLPHASTGTRRASSSTSTRPRATRRRSS